MRYFIIFFGLLLLLVTSCNSRTTIANGLSEREANEIVVLLASRNIPAEKIAAPAGTGAGGRANLWDISVPASQITDALAILNQSGLPRIQGSNLLELFGAQRIVPSDLQDRVRYQEGLAAQLANTIRMMDGIIDANVQITLVNGQGDEMNPENLTASIYIRHRGILDNPNSTLVNKIRRLVSSALPGLRPENVTVVADRAGFGEFREDEHLQGEQEGFVQIWGIAIAQRSVFLFRVIFYSFILLLFITLALLVWLGWKFYPIVEKAGFRSLLNLEPYQPESPPPPKEEL